MSTKTAEEDEITLKWGTLKGWKFSKDNAQALKLLTEYHEIGADYSAMLQKDTPRQKEIICELIDLCNSDDIYLDWDGKHVTKDEAKKYVMEYGRDLRPRKDC